MKKEMNHAAYQANLKKRTDAELVFMKSDCREALTAYPESENAGYYQDEIHYINDEMNRRSKARPAPKTKSAYIPRTDGDDRNEAFLFGMTHTDLLVAIADGRINAKTAAKRELANRGLGKNGAWVGFDKAAKIHGIK